jgi:hypothetical protein
MKVVVKFKKRGIWVNIEDIEAKIGNKTGDIP